MFAFPTSCHVCRPSLTFRDSIGPSKLKDGLHAQGALSVAQAMMHDNIQAEREIEREGLEEDKCPPHVQIDAFDAHTEWQEELHRLRANYLGALCLFRSV